MGAQVTSSEGVGYADITAMAQSLGASGQNMQKAAQDLIQTAVDDITRYAQQFAPKKSGVLTQSIHGDVDAGNLIGTVSAGAKYALFVELGTGTRGEFPTHEIVIRPKNASVLRWRGPDGKIHFAKVVRSPGMKSHPFLRPALQKAIEDLETSIGVAASVSVLEGMKT